MGTTEMKVGVALITIINPPVNSLSFDGSEGKFSGGFDIAAFGGMQGGKNKQPKRGCISMDVFTNMFEGTQQLPHLVGLSKALEMMLMSKPIKAEEAQALGLVDAIVPSDELVMTACRWALDIVEHRKPWIITLYRSDKLEPVGEAREILKFARAQAHRQAHNLQHPLVCIDVMEEGVVSGPHAGLWKVNTSYDGQRLQGNWILWDVHRSIQSVFLFFSWVSFTGRHLFLKYTYTVMDASRR